MKKVIFGGLFLILVSFGLTGCQKKVSSNTIFSDTKEVNNGISVNENIVSFKSIEAYENFVSSEIVLNDREQTLKMIKDSEFKSYQESKQFEFIAKSSDDEDADDEIDEVDDFFGQLLNKDAAIVIEDYLFKIDFLNEKVYVIKFNPITDSYKSIISKINNLAQGVLIFSTEDDILSLLTNNESSSQELKTKSCSKANINPEIWNTYYDNKASGSKRIRYRCKLRVRYFNIGIYRSLTSTFTHQKKKGIGVWKGEPTSFSIGYLVTWSNNPGGQHGNVSHNPNYLEYWAKDRTIKHYNGTKCLMTFDLKAWSSFLNLGNTNQVLQILGDANHRITNI